MSTEDGKMDGETIRHANAGRNTVGSVSFVMRKYLLKVARVVVQKGIPWPTRLYESETPSGSLSRRKFGGGRGG